MILEPRGAGHRALEDHGMSRGSSCISVRLCPRAVGQYPACSSAPYCSVPNWIPRAQSLLSPGPEDSPHE